MCACVCVYRLLLLGFGDSSWGVVPVNQLFKEKHVETLLCLCQGMTSNSVWEIQPREAVRHPTQALSCKSGVGDSL